MVLCSRYQQGQSSPAGTKDRQMSKTFFNTSYAKRNYDCTNVVACISDAAPGPNWIECGEEVLAGLTKLHRQGGAVFYGYL